MLAPVDNEAVVLTVLSDRFRLPLDRLVTEAVHPSMTARAFVRHGGAVVGVAPEQAARLRDLLDGHDTVAPALKALAAELPGHMFSGTARTGVVIPAPVVEVTVLDASDPRLPQWVQGHFVGEAWVVMEGGEVLSTAVLKRYDERLREISVGTAPSARGRGLARAVVAAAARFVLAEDRAVLYNHAVDNDVSARMSSAPTMRWSPTAARAPNTARTTPPPSGPATAGDPRAAPDPRPLLHHHRRNPLGRA